MTNARITKTDQTKSPTFKALTVLRLFQTIETEFPLQYAICLLEIAQDEGISHTMLAERTNMPLSTVSRIVGALSDHRQKGVPFELLEVTISSTSRRSKNIRLSDKGRRFIERLEALI